MKKIVFAVGFLLTILLAYGEEIEAYSAQLVQTYKMGEEDSSLGYTKYPSPDGHEGPNNFTFLQDGDLLIKIPTKAGLFVLKV